MDWLYDDSYFDMDADYDTACESMTLLTIGTVLSITGDLISIIKSNLRREKFQKLTGVMLDVNKVAKSGGFSEEAARKEYKKALNFLISKNYVTDNVTIKTDKVYYKDLTQEGCEFILGYFEHIGKIDTFTLKKAAQKLDSSGKLSRAQDLGSAVALLLCEALGVGFWTGAGIAAGMASTAIPLGAVLTILAIIIVTTDFKFMIKRFDNLEKFKKNNPANASESVLDVFDDYYFET